MLRDELMFDVNVNECLGKDKDSRDRIEELKRQKSWLKLTESKISLY